MPESATIAKFSCPKCGKKGKWSLNIAGRKVKCRCGATFIAPATLEAAERETEKAEKAAQKVAAEATAAAESESEVETASPQKKPEKKPEKKVKAAVADVDDDGLYELAPANIQTGGPRKPTEEAAPGAPSGPGASFITPRKRYNENEEPDDGVKNKTIPVVLIACAVVLNIIFGATMKAGDEGFMIVARHVFTKFGISVGIMLAGYFSAVSSFKADFGPKKGEAIFKLIAIAVAPLMAVGFVSLVGGAGNNRFIMRGALQEGWLGFGVDAGLSLLLFVGLFTYLLSMKFKERMVLILGMWALHVAAAGVLIRFLVG